MNSALLLPDSNFDQFDFHCFKSELYPKRSKVEPSSLRHGVATNGKFEKDAARDAIATYLDHKAAMKGYNQSASTLTLHCKKQGYSVLLSNKYHISMVMKERRGNRRRNLPPTKVMKKL